MKKILTYWLVLVLGIFLILPKIGFEQLGNLVEGPISWVIPILILVIAITRLIAAYKEK